MGNCLNSYHKGATEEDFEASRYGSSTDLEHNQSPVLESKIQREKDGVITVKKSSINKEEKGVVRVKIVLSKQDAARLLSKLEGGGEEDVLGAAISELRSTKKEPCCDAWGPVLESIPEDTSIY